MVSLSLVILTFIVIFAGLYFVIKMNQSEPLHKAPQKAPRRHKHLRS